MTSRVTDLPSLARSKLSSSVTSKDNCSLHRWVLLKNSIIRSAPLPAPTVTTPETTYALRAHDELLLAYQEDDCDCLDDEEVGDSFMFPDAGSIPEAGNILSDHASAEPNSSEDQWLASVLESLEDDDDYMSSVPAPDEDLISPPNSPSSSSDDLTDPSFYPTLGPFPYSYLYPVPYPPLRPPLIHHHECDDISFHGQNRPTVPSLTLPFDALPYRDLEDMGDDISMPDAIEDDSDDESDVPCTPMLTNSTGSSLSSSADPASIPLPEERQREPRLHVYIDSETDYFYPFELDPLPFPDDMHSSYNRYPQEC